MTAVWYSIRQFTRALGLFLQDFLLIAALVGIVCALSYLHSLRNTPSASEREPIAPSLPVGWRAIQESEGLRDDNVMRVAEVDSDAVLLSCESGFCLWTDGQITSFDAFNKKLFYKSAEEMMPDGAGGVWVTLDKKRDSLVTAFGVWHFDGTKFRKVRELTCCALTAVRGEPPAAWASDRWSGELVRVELTPGSSRDVSVRKLGDECVAIIADAEKRVWFFKDDSFGWFSGDEQVDFADGAEELRNYPGRIRNVDVLVGSNGLGFFCWSIAHGAAYTWNGLGPWQEHASLWDALKENEGALIRMGAVRNSELWAVSEARVIALNKVLHEGEWQEIPALGHLGPLGINRILVRQNGEIWLATRGAGVLVCDSVDDLLNRHTEP
ncbi:MAG: hypothetical protein V2B19_20865 [Pseudomonadota bacterium]